MAYKQQKFIYHKTRGWKVLDLGAGRFPVVVRAQVLVHGPLLMVSSQSGRGRELSWTSFITTLMPFIRVPPKAPSQTTSPCGLGFQNIYLRGIKHLYHNIVYQFFKTVNIIKKKWMRSSNSTLRCLFKINKSRCVHKDLYTTAHSSTCSQSPQTIKIATEWWRKRQNVFYVFTDTPIGNKRTKHWCTQLEWIVKTWC